MAQNITLLGANYSAVPAVELPITGGGTATFTDVTSTTATASDVASGKIFYDSSGTETTGTASGGGGLNWQITNANKRISGSSYVSTGLTLTVDVSGTYTIYYTACRTTTSGTSGTRLYINGSQYGSNYTSWSNSYIQTISVTGVSLSAGDVLTIYARSRNSSYYVCVGNLVIEQTA